MNENVFDRSYYYVYEDKTSENYIKRQVMYQQELKRIYRYVGQPINKILDYGCGLGNFLELFEPDCKKYGVEISEYAQNEAMKKNIKFDIHKEDEGTFDLVVFRGSIAYIDDKKEVLKYATSMLSDKGSLILLSVPNPKSLCYRLFHTLPLLEPDKQHYLCSSTEIVSILRNLGFKSIRIKKPYWDTPYAKRGSDVFNFIKRLIGKKTPPFAFWGNVYEIYAKRK